MLNRTRRRIAGLALLAALAGCASDATAGELNLGTTSASTSTTVAPSVPVTSAVPVTEAPAPSTTVPATEAPTTTPTTPAVSVEDQVRADYEAARLAREECLYDPVGCDIASIAIPGSPVARNVADTAATYIDSNLRAIRGIGDIKLRVEDVKVVGDSAYVTICAYDTVVVFDIADPVDPNDDITFNDNLNSFRSEWELRQQSGKWLLFDSRSIDGRIGGDLCGF
jgi:hypothetical protein